MEVYVLSVRIDYEDNNTYSSVLGVYKNWEDANAKLEELERKVYLEHGMKYDEKIECDYPIFDGKNYYFYTVNRMVVQ